MPSGPTEAVIPGAIRGTDREVPRFACDDFAALVREHQAMVFSIAYSSLRDRAVAEEIAQDVFLELHKVLPTLESPNHVVHWLRRVAVHRSIDSIRKKRSTLSLADVREPSVPADGGDMLLEARLRRLVSELTPKGRAAIILRYQEDLDPGQIAEILEVPVQTVKSRIHRSLALLRTKLERAGRSRHA